MLDGSFTFIRKKKVNYMRKSKTYPKHELKKKNQTIKDAFLFDLAT